MGLVYNTKEASKPASYQDLLNPKYKGRVGIPTYGWVGNSASVARARTRRSAPARSGADLHLGLCRERRGIVHPGARIARHGSALGRAQPKSAATRAWDYVVIGAGAAGCVVAGRLSQTMPEARVALIEAGGARLELTTKVPGTAFIASTSARRNWNFETEPVPALNGRKLSWFQGRILGGSGSDDVLVIGADVQIVILEAATECQEVGFRLHDGRRLSAHWRP